MHLDFQQAGPDLAAQQRTDVCERLRDEQRLGQRVALQQPRKADHPVELTAGQGGGDRTGQDNKGYERTEQDRRAQYDTGQS